MNTPRLLKQSDFDGKTIIFVDVRAVNCMTFHFKGGTTLTIEVEGLGHGVQGLVTYGPEENNP